MKKKIISTLSVFIVIMFFFCGCVEKNVEVASKKGERNYIVYDINSEPKDLVMLNNFNIKEQNILLNLFDGLVGFNKDDEIEGQLAQKWKVNKDKTKYKFILKDNIYWNDGEKIIAKDFEDFFRDIIEYSRKNNLKMNDLKCIYGVSEYMNTGDLEKIAIKAKEDNSLEIALNYPCDYFLDILAKPCYKLRKVDSKLSNYKNTYKSISYSGAFVIDRVEKQGIMLKKNYNYWDKDKIKKQKIKINFNKSVEESLASFKMGKIDTFMDPPYFELGSLKDNKLITERNIPNLKILSINNKRIKNINLRKAINYCIDRHYICNEIYNGVYKEATSYIPKKIGNKSTAYDRKYFSEIKNESKAKELLKEMLKKEKELKKYSEGEFVLKLISKNTLEDKKTCEYISKDIKKILNINVVWKSYGDQQKLNDAIKEGQYDIVLTECDGMHSSALELLTEYTKSSYKNYYNYNNLQYDLFLKNVIIEKNLKKRKEFIYKCEDVLKKDYCILPLAFKKSILCNNSKIDGVYMTKLGNVIFKYYEFLSFN